MSSYLNSPDTDSEDEGKGKGKATTNSNSNSNSNSSNSDVNNSASNDSNSNSNNNNNNSNENEDLSIDLSDKAAVLEAVQQLKAEGNAHFSKSEFDQALSKYSQAVVLLKKAELPRDVLILLNRSATYLALKRYVPAMNDAIQGEIDNF